MQRNSDGNMFPESDSLSDTRVPKYYPGIFALLVDTYSVL